MGEGIDYASSGVDIDLEGHAVSSLIGALGGSVRLPGTVGAPVDLQVVLEDLSNLEIIIWHWLLMELVQNYRLLRN